MKLIRSVATIARFLTSSSKKPNFTLADIRKRSINQQRKSILALETIPKLQQVMSKVINYHSVRDSSTNLSNENVGIKTIDESYVEEYLRFKSVPSIREDYVNMYGQIRIGKILEDFDCIAAYAAYLHCDDASSIHASPVTIVTASVDRLDLLQEIPPDQDIKISGFVSFVGTSSMEITLRMEKCLHDAPAAGLEIIGEIPKQNEFNDSRLLMTARFIMVALDRNTKIPVKINQLRLQSPKDFAYFSAGKAHKSLKVQEKKMAIEKTVPSLEEYAKIHELYQEYIKYLDPSFETKKPENVVWMKDTIKSSLHLCMPQDRNIHNKIFGGYLMRLAYELAYSTGFIFAKSRLSFIALDDITFRKPVNIGSLLLLTSQVVYASGYPSKTFQIKVKADVIEPEKNTQQTTNTFMFTFALLNDQKLCRVIPRSYDESMRYLEGRRTKMRWKNSQFTKND